MTEDELRAHVAFASTREFQRAYVKAKRIAMQSNHAKKNAEYGSEQLKVKAVTKAVASVIRSESRMRAAPWEGIGRRD